MIKLKNILLALSLIVLFSCSGNYEDVNMDLLREYELFEYTSKISYPDDLTKYDTIIYWFASEDSVIAYRKFYEQTAFELPQLVKQDTIEKRYFTDINMVYFSYPIGCWAIYDTDPLLNSSWKVINIDSDELKIKQYLGDYLIGNIKLKTLNK